MEKFSHLSVASRVWIYQADRAFSAAESKDIDEAVALFASQWRSHNAKVEGAGGVLYDRFVVLAADEEAVGLGGCSIDGTVRFVKELGSKYNVNFFDRFYTCYIKDGAIEGADFEVFKTKLAQGFISDETIVFNNLVKTLGEMREKWQLPLSQSWHSKFLGQQIFRL